MKTFERDWKEGWIDQMGLIVALSAQDRFRKLDQFKHNMVQFLTPTERLQLKLAIKERFTPSNGSGGCASGTEAVQMATE